MNKNETFKFLKQNLSNANLIKHSLAVSAAMEKLGNYFNEDTEKWGICGLVHDIDYEKIQGRMEEHSKMGAEMLKQAGFDEEIWKAVLTHNEAHGILPETRMAKALYCVDPLTGLIVAATLVLPSKKIGDLKPENIINRFGEKAFARGANREIIAKCQDLLEITIEEFTKITLEAMQSIADKLGL